MKRILLTLILTIATATCGLTAVSADGISADVKAETGVVRVLPTGLEVSVKPAAESAVRFEVFGITGQLVTAVTVEPNEKQIIDIRKGCYIVRTIQDGKSYSKRFTVQ